MRYAKPGQIELVDLEVPEPGPGEVQVQGLVCGVCTWDLYTFKAGPDAPSAAPPGHEGLGRVVKVGPGVKNVKEGARVLGRGFSEFYNMPADKLHLVPEESKLPDEHWIIEPVACVVNGVDHCQVRAADRIVVVGCGFMGLMILQVLGRSFADQVIAVDVDPARLELAKRFGATMAFNSAAPDWPDRLAEIKAMQIDTTVDSTGAQAGLNIASQITRRGGRINLFGWNHGATTFPGDAWHLGGFTVVNSAPASGLRDSIPIAIRLINRGIINLQPLVTHVVPLERYQELLVKGVSKTDGYIKGVVRLTGGKA